MIIIYKSVKELANHLQNSNRAVVFSNRPLPNFLKYRDLKELFQKKRFRGVFDQRFVLRSAKTP